MTIADIAYIKANCIGKSQQTALANLQSRFPGKNVSYTEPKAGFAKCSVDGKLTIISLNGFPAK